MGNIVDKISMKWEKHVDAFQTLQYFGEISSMKRFLSITAVIFLAAPAFADILSFTDKTAVDTTNCNTVPMTATLTLPGAPAVNVNSVGHAMRKQKVIFTTQNGYCANILVSDSSGFDKALAAKDDTGAAIRNVISGQGGSNGMLFAIRMDVVLVAPAFMVESKYKQALQQNTQQSAAALSAEPSTGPLNSFLSLAQQGGGSDGTQNIVVTIDGRQGPTFGQVYYQGTDGKLLGPVTSPNASFVQNMVAIWYGNTESAGTPGGMDPMHKPFELSLLGL